jgi:HSP20 family protein
MTLEEAAMFQTIAGFNRGRLEDFRRIEEQLDELLGAWPRAREIRYSGFGAFPPMNIGGTADSVDIYVFAAGLDPAKLDISIQKNLLTISGERVVQRNDARQYYRQERFSGAFRRVVSLPDDVDPDRVEASYRNGVLHVVVQRRESSKPRQIEVKTSR